MCSDQTAEGIIMILVITNLYRLSLDYKLIIFYSKWWPFCWLPWELGCQHKKSIHFFTLGTMPNPIAKKYLHIFKEEKKSYQPGVWYRLGSFLRFEAYV